MGVINLFRWGLATKLSRENREEIAMRISYNQRAASTNRLAFRGAFDPFHTAQGQLSAAAILGV
jgi:hypothetical protein